MTLLHRIISCCGVDLLHMLQNSFISIVNHCHMYLYVFICIYMYLYVFICIYMYLYVFICIYMYLYVFICIYMYLYVFICIYMFITHFRLAQFWAINQTSAPRCCPMLPQSWARCWQGKAASLRRSSVFHMYHSQDWPDPATTISPNSLRYTQSSKFWLRFNTPSRKEIK